MKSILSISVAVALMLANTSAVNNFDAGREEGQKIEPAFITSEVPEEADDCAMESIAGLMSDVILYPEPFRGK